MASIETLEKVMVQQLRSENNSQVKHDFMFGVFAISLGIAAVLSTGWYLFFGPALMDLWSPMHLFLIQSINSIPAPETNDKLYEILLEQGYVSVVQIKELSEMAHQEVQDLLINQ
ncbi:hypothetical protein V9N52_003891 [Vibrio navarrensis]